MTWLSTALPYVGGGVLGAGVTYGLTWVRERRRTLDAYRAPQRQAIGEIITATHEYMLRELEQRTVMGDLVEQVRQDRHIVAREESDAAMKALGRAVLDVERAFAIGTLTIVDAPCWEAMGAAYVQLALLRGAMETAPVMESTEEVEHYVETIRVLAAQFNTGVSALVRAAIDRVSPAETFWNPWRRRRARGRLGKLYQRLHAVDTPDVAPQPDY